MSESTSRVTIFRGYRTELDPTTAQVALFRKCAGAGRWTYNWGLQRKIASYRAGVPVPSTFELEKELGKLKRGELPWLRQVSKHIPEEALKDLESAFQSFYRGLHGGRKSGFPRFKARRRTACRFRIAGWSLKITSTHIWIARVGWVRLKEHDYIPSSGVHYVTVTVRERAGRWFVGVSVSEPRVACLAATGPIVGVDVGLLHLATLSDGTVYDGPRALKRFDRRLRRAHKSLSRKTTGSANRDKSARALARLYLRVENARLDATHKITTQVTRTKSLIVIEDFQTRNLMGNRRVAKAFQDAGISALVRQLEYKSRWRGGSVLRAPRFFPSTRICSGCGWIADELPLRDRTYRCQRCGLVLDRDVNAAKNLEALAASPADSNACGEDVRPYSAAVVVEAGTVACDGGRARTTAAEQHSGPPRVAPCDLARHRRMTARRAKVTV